MLIRSLIAAVVMFVASAQAQEAANPPPPATHDEAGVAAWVENHISTDGWLVIGFDEAAVALTREGSISRTANGMPFADVRHEYFRPMDFDGQPIRSVLQVVVFECDHVSQAIAAMTIFENNNMSRNHGFRQFQPPQWTDAAAGTLKEQTIRAVCQAAQN